MLRTSESLLDALRRPDDPKVWQKAWARFVDLYTPLLFDWARRLGLQPNDAEDLVQNVFTTLFQVFPRFKYDRQGSFRAWLHTVLKNDWHNWKRRRSAAPLGGAGDCLPDPAGSSDPAALDEAEYRRHLVHRALQLMQAEFEPTTWKACWEFVAGGKRAAVVAADLGISVNAVYLAKSRVLRRLREELDGQLD